MAEYRKKPVVIEAEQWTPFREGNAWSPMPPGRQLRHRRGFWDCLCGRMYHWEIRTLEGWLRVSPGDWIITGVKNEQYPCKPDIFETTYEAVT